MRVINSFSGEYRWLSNFYPVTMVLGTEERVYPSVEHAYQAAKTFDQDEREIISRLPRPGDAKRYGRRVTLRPDWENVKLDVMRELLQQKFTEPTLCEKLLATGDAELVEGNHWGDRFWGVCGGAGANQLGRLLVEVRQSLR